MKTFYTRSNLHRLPEFQIQTNFIGASDSSQPQLIQKRALCSQALSHLVNLEKNHLQLVKQKLPFSILVPHRLKDNSLTFPYLPQPTLAKLIETALIKKEFALIIDYLDQYLSLLNQLEQTSFNPYQSQEFVHIFDPHQKFLTLQKFPASSIGFIDLNFSNLLVKPATSNFTLIDQEWLLASPLPLEFIGWLALTDLGLRLQGLIQTFCSTQFPCLEILPGFYLPLAWWEKFNFSSELLPTFHFWQQNFSRYVHSSQHSVFSQLTVSASSQPRTLLQGSLSSWQQLDQLRQENLRLHRQLQTQNSGFAQFKKKLGQIYHREKDYFLHEPLSLYPQRLHRRLGQKNFFRRLDSSSLNSHPHLSSPQKILIISGASGTVSEIHRIDHLTEKLNILKIDFTLLSQARLIFDLPADLSSYDYLYLHRCVTDPPLDALVDRFKHTNLPILFDLDDLVFDEEILPQVQAFKNLDLSQQTVFRQTTSRHLQLMTKADALIFPTQYLADYYQHFTSSQQQIFVLPNHLDQTTLDTARQFGLLKLAVQKQNLAAPVNSFTLGYFPGTKTHDQDFQLLVPTLKELFIQFPFLKLKIVGHLTLPSELTTFIAAGRIQLIPFVPYHRLIQQYFDVDLNLIPLELNAFCQAKSELKYFFAGACGIPSLASSTQPFQLVAQRSTGCLLCSQVSDWRQIISELISSPVKLHQASQAAFTDVHDYYQPGFQAQNLANIFVQISQLPQPQLHSPRTFP